MFTQSFSSLDQGLVHTTVPTFGVVTLSRYYHLPFGQVPSNSSFTGTLTVFALTNTLRVVTTPHMKAVQTNTIAPNGWLFKKHKVHG